MGRSQPRQSGFARFAPYVEIARLDYWPKGAFVVLGALAALASPVRPGAGWLILEALLACSLLSSANYVANEWMDRESDRHHPTKGGRPCVRGQIRGRWAAVEYALLSISGLFLAARLSLDFLLVSLVFLGVAGLYNFAPIRMKDRVVLDILTESLMLPLRIAMGWIAARPDDGFPPLALLVVGWLGACGAAALKREREMAVFLDLEMAARYRRPFGRYNRRWLARVGLALGALSVTLILLGR
jgi:4-hydroxybenzoate polyprenyltransferase